MKRRFILATVCALLSLSTAAYAVNGDNLMAIGPIARSMGGVGTAAPQDAISAVFANPAAMCFGPYCPASEFNFGSTLFMPKVDAKVTQGANTFKADSDEKVYFIPAVGVSVPITSSAPFWRFGVAAYGVSGLGVDYRGTSIDQRSYAGYGGMAPLITGEYSELAIMKFAPAIAFQPFERLSFGLAAHLDYSTLDLRQGTSTGFGGGAQIGTIYKVTDNVSLGLNYVTPQSVDYGNVIDLDSDGRQDSLTLESPQQVSLGVAYTTLSNRLLMEADFKWINWADATGYSAFDWDNQWVAALGAQYKPIPKLVLRAGYNYGSNPVKTHNGFNGMTTTSVQGHRLPTYYYETFRIIGFPAVVEHHVSFGAGYDFTPRFSVNLGYVHGFENTITERGTDFTGQPVSLKSTLSENSVDFGLTWRF